MWDTNTIWFEIALVSSSIALGNILLGHFEEKTPRRRKLLKYLAALALVVCLSYFFGQKIALIVYGLLFLPVFYIHCIDLPKKESMAGQENLRQLPIINCTFYTDLFPSDKP